MRGDGDAITACSFEALLARLHGHTTLILGPSGAGKSTLINRAVPGAAAQTGEISQALNSGKHTTTTTTWYWLDDARTSALIDSPGFQEFGLRHIDPMQHAPARAGVRGAGGGHARCPSARQRLSNRRQSLQDLQRSVCRTAWRVTPPR